MKGGHSDPCSSLQLAWISRDKEDFLSHPAKAGCPGLQPVTEKALATHSTGLQRESGPRPAAPRGPGGAGAAGGMHAPPHLPESRSGGGDRLGPSWVPHRGRSGSRARSLVGARSSRWRRLADGCSFLFLDAHRSQIPIRRLQRTGTPTRAGEAGEGAPGQLSLPWWVSVPPLWPSRAPSPCSPSPGRPDDSPPPRHESSGPGVYGVALGTGGLAKVPGFLHASRGWAPLLAAVVSLPLTGLFLPPDKC